MQIWKGSFGWCLGAADRFVSETMSLTTRERSLRKQMLLIFLVASLSATALPRNKKKCAALITLTAPSSTTSVRKISPTPYDIINPHGSNFDAYRGRHIRNILFLSDGPRPRSLAESVANEFPRKRIVKSDVQILQTATSNNLTLVHVNNRLKFPFEENSFDMIVMRRGLCLCGGNETCGGIKLNRVDQKRFLFEVARVLNKNNPFSSAFLLNDNAGAFQDISGWQRAAADVIAKVPEIEIEIIDSAGKFDGVKFTTKNSNQLTTKSSPPGQNRMGLKKN